MKLNALILSFLIYPALGNAQDIRFITHSIENETFIDDKGDLRGKAHAGKRAFNIELVRALKKDTIYSYTPIIEVPLVRALYSVLNQDGIAAFNVSRTSLREKFAKWVGPLQIDELYFYRLKSKDNIPTEISIIKNNYTTCVKNGSNFHEQLSSIEFSKLIIVNSYPACFQMLVAKRVDFAVLSKWHLDSVLSVGGIDKKLIEEALLYKKTEGHIAFSLDTSNQLITQWQNKLDLFKRDGTYQALKERFLLPLKPK